jgi:hypothetical protein
MENEILIGHMGILIKVVDSRCVKAGRPALDAVNLITFLEEEFR